MTSQTNQNTRAYRAYVDFSVLFDRFELVAFMTQSHAKFLKIMVILLNETCITVLFEQNIASGLTSLLRRRCFGSSRIPLQRTLGRKDCVTSQRNVCEGGYGLTERPLLHWAPPSTWLAGDVGGVECLAIHDLS